MSKKQKITNDIKAQNQNWEVLKTNFSHCFDKNGNFDFEKFKNELSANEINFSKESYGLDWLGKSYARILASDSATTLLKEDEKHNQRQENKSSENLLIKGDNLEVLKHLTNAYYEKVKMIYIDPPYNTGSDGFVYQDDRKFTVAELKELAGLDEEKAKRILDFTQSNSNSHSAWLTFMYPRLYIAKQLLREDGVIFVSIDDNEVAQLRLLMDEVFGVENFIATICHKSRASISNDKIISENHNYVLLFAKDKEQIFKARSQFGLEPELNSFKEEDKNGKFKFVPVSAPGGSKKGNPFYSFKGIEGYYRFSEETMNKMYEDGLVVIKGKTVLQKYYLSKAEKSRKTDNTWWDEGFYTSSATAKLNSLMGDEYFTNPKSIDAIKKMLTLVNDKHCLILDFFAGSGTTGDAVMQLNAEDGGNRKYILVQLPEHIDPKKSKAAYDFVKRELLDGKGIPTIFEITKERLKRASLKIVAENIDQPAKSEKIKCEGIHEEHCPACKGDYTLKTEAKSARDLSNTDLGFKIFETIPIWDDYNFKADRLEVEATLFDDDKLTQDDVKALLVTWKTYDGMPLTQDLQTIDLNGYKGYYAHDKLYLMDKGFTTDNLKTLLERIDTDKDFNPASIIAFGYYFESKNLREISENMKSYANKKNIDIDFVTRY